MKKVTLAASLLFLAGMANAADAPKTVATVGEVKGSVLIEHANKRVVAEQGMTLQEGDTVFVLEKAAIDLAYATCQAQLGQNTLLTVSSGAPCATGMQIGVGQATAGAAAGTGGGAGGAAGAAGAGAGGAAGAGAAGAGAAGAGAAGAGAAAAGAGAAAAGGIAGIGAVGAGVAAAAVGAGALALKEIDDRKEESQAADNAVQTAAAEAAEAAATAAATAASGS